MKIKTRPDGVGMLEGDELFRMNGWLAELRDEGRAEPRDDGRPEAEENSDTESRNGGTDSQEDSYARSQGDAQASPRGDSQAGSQDDGQASPRDASQAGSRDDSQAGSRDDSQAGSRDDSQAGSRDDSQAGWRDDSQAGSLGDSRVGSRDEGRLGPWDDGQAGSGENGQARPRDDSQAKRPWPSYLRPGASAARPATRAVARAGNTARAVIGDQLRLPIMWCEMGSCISWFAHPAALGEADTRARAIDAGWRVDAVGLLVCPQCLQTASGFQSPVPVVPWNREKAIAIFAQMADEPSTEVIASAARELSHDLRRPVSSHPDEVAAASAWTAALPAGDVAPSADRGTSDEVRHPAGDREPDGHPRSGRHRKRLAARLMFASQ
jgi:hypothetical protein